MARTDGLRAAAGRGGGRRAQLTIGIAAAVLAIIACRQLHSLLTPFHPDIHCPHCSPGGGGTCIDVTYDSFFEVEF